MVSNISLVNIPINSYIADYFRVGCHVHIDLYMLDGSISMIIYLFYYVHCEQVCLCSSLRNKVLRGYYGPKFCVLPKFIC